MARHCKLALFQYLAGEDDDASAKNKHLNKMLSRRKLARNYSELSLHTACARSPGSTMHLRPACSSAKIFDVALLENNTQSASPRSPRSGTRSPQSGARSPRSGKRSPRSGARSGTRSPRSGARSPRSGTRSPRSGTRSPRSGTRSPRSGPRSPRSGTRSHHDAAATHPSLPRKTEKLIETQLADTSIVRKLKKQASKETGSHIHPSTRITLSKEEERWSENESSGSSESMPPEARVFSCFDEPSLQDSRRKNTSAKKTRPPATSPIFS
ncbi:unnamed protein product [Gongylonema pulchrum]|uniref:Uncharacterized protein n=1 Tax=Gongylonema pulchrum TaxID=637853 RepID=A0A3P6R095_9BILA|nr:unnamed protein product [Gongylonema pulchrum]